MDFWWFIPQKGPVLVILVPGMIQPSQSVMFLMKWGCRGHWGHGGCWGCGGQLRLQRLYGIENFYWGLEIHPGSWIQLYFDDLKTKFWGVESWNLMFDFSTFSVEASLFWKLVEETQMPTTPEATRHHHSRNLLILLCLRAI